MAIKKFIDEYGNIIKTKGSPKPGGEGDVYDVSGNPDIVVKIYNDKKRSDAYSYNRLMKKIKAMCDIFDEDITKRAAWPLRIVYSNNEPVGFVMNKIKFSNPIHQLTDSVDRNAKFIDSNWKFSFVVACNLACALKALHDKDIVIGDINESNFLIGNRAIAQKEGIVDFVNNGIVYCIDCDSFQFQTKSEDFLCTVNKPEYFPPELVGKDLHRTLRTKNQDNYGLAVMIFQIIMQGIHPFAGIGSSFDVVESSLNGHYIFSEKAIKNNIFPPYPSKMYAKIYNSLNQEIRLLFNQAFCGDLDSKRPTAQDWVRALRNQIEDLVQCKNKNHFHNKNSNCIWCDIEKEYGIAPWKPKLKIVKSKNVSSVFSVDVKTSANTSGNISNDSAFQSNTVEQSCINEEKEKDLFCEFDYTENLSFIDLAPSSLSQKLIPDWLLESKELKNLKHSVKKLRIGDFAAFKDVFYEFYKLFLKTFFRLIIKPAIISFLIFFLIKIFIEDINANFGFAVFIATSIFEFLPHKILMQPIRAITYISLIIVLLFVYNPKIVAKQNIQNENLQQNYFDNSLQY